MSSVSPALGATGLLFTPTGREIRKRCMLPKPLAVTLTLTCLLGAVGCGHPASESECKELAEHIARLRLQGRGFDEAEITRRVAEAEKDPEYQKTMDGCVGQRITDSSVACIKAAKTPEEIKTKCAR
ncbi:MAG: hypothetical protein H6718_29210 [Polyangiaceae bacterium]|nr:hypothetical protein [Polyangiaceae bacterium]